MSSPSHLHFVRNGPPYGSVLMSQVALPVPVHMKLGPVPVLVWSATYASLRQPTCGFALQRPAPCGQTQVFVPPGPPVAASEPEVQRPFGTSCRSHG